MATVHNPILRGFHPDPCILRVEDEFYIATSTFEWFPGVMIYHSRDLVDWKLISRPLTRVSQLNMMGNPPSGGVWAPALSFDHGLFYLVYTNVRTWKGSHSNLNDGFKDTHNYFVTAPSIEGPWSEPIYLNSSGFDPSLFHDDDGKKWLVNMLWDYRIGRNHFGGIILQEYDPRKKTLVGPIEKIFDGTEIGYTEGPHLYKRKDWYYLLTAEGGTSYGHAVTMARSRSLSGPYEVHPENPLLTSVKDRKDLSTLSAQGIAPFPALHEGLQKAGHGSLCEWRGDEWVLAHLCGRPLPGTANCPLGRETALQKVVWKEDGWPYISGGNNPKTSVTFSGPEIEHKVQHEFRDDFDRVELNPHLQTLRIPADSLLSLSERPGWLRMFGEESIASPFRQSLVGLRVQSFHFYAETSLEFKPDNFQQMAGLLLRYDEANQYYLRVSRDEEKSINTLGLLIFTNGEFSMPEVPKIAFSEKRIFLSCHMEERNIQFLYSYDRMDWDPIGPELDSSLLSDDHVDPLGFTGMFLCLGCQDLSGRHLYADFDYLMYNELKNG